MSSGSTNVSQHSMRGARLARAMLGPHASPSVGDVAQCCGWVNASQQAAIASCVFSMCLRPLERRASTRLRALQLMMVWQGKFTCYAQKSSESVASPEFAGSKRAINAVLMTDFGLHA